MPEEQPHQALPRDMDHLIRLADEGEWWALARVYGQASAWLSAARPIPEPLGSWLGLRMAEVAKLLNAKGKTAVRDRRAQHAKILTALRVIRSGKKGRPVSRQTELLRRALFGDVQEFISRGSSPTQACKQVVELHQRLKTPISVDLKTVEAVWAARSKK